MTKTAIIACLSANSKVIPALEADIKKNGVDEVVCLGDFISLGPDPIEVTKWVMANCKVCLGSYAEVAVYDPSILEGYGAERRRLSILDNAQKLQEVKPCLEFIEALPSHATLGNALLFSNCFSKGFFPEYERNQGAPVFSFSDIDSSDHREAVDVGDAYAAFGPWSIAFWNGPGMHWWLDVAKSERRVWEKDLQIPYSSNRKVIIGGMVSGGWQGYRFLNKASYVILDDDTATLRVISYNN